MVTFYSLRKFSRSEALRTFTHNDYELLKSQSGIATASGLRCSDSEPTAGEVGVPSADGKGEALVARAKGRTGFALTVLALLAILHGRLHS